MGAVGLPPRPRHRQVWKPALGQAYGLREAFLCPTQGPGHSFTETNQAYLIHFFPQALPRYLSPLPGPFQGRMALGPPPLWLGIPLAEARLSCGRLWISG